MGMALVRTILLSQHQVGVGVFLDGPSLFLLARALWDAAPSDSAVVGAF